MDFILSGLVVDSQGLAYHSAVLAMEPDSTSREREKKLKMEIKREKNRESSARSRQRKKDEDERNEREIERLEHENEQLRGVVERLMSEGQEILQQVQQEYPQCFTEPPCPGCAPKNGDEAETSNSPESQDPSVLSLDLLSDVLPDPSPGL